MSKKVKIKIDKPLTEVELQLMNVIWTLGSCTVKDVLTEINKERELAYTSIATIMKILETKGFVKSIKDDKAHIYSPVIAKEDYETQSLDHLAENLFHGDPTIMVMRLLNDSQISKKDLEAIKQVLEARIDS